MLILARSLNQSDRGTIKYPYARIHMNYITFTRTWWIHNPKWPNGLEPGPGKRTYHDEYETEQEAREAAQAWNRENDPGDLSLKMEFEEI
jgi:hypothetical protein